MPPIPSCSRNYRLLAGCFFRFLFPTIFAAASMQLSFVIGGIFVGRYLGPEPLATMNLALPLIQVFASCGAFFGIGGTVLIALYKGEDQNQKCSEIFTLSLMGMLIAGLLFLGLGLLFQHELAAFLAGNNPVLIEHLSDYLFPLFLASPLFILTLGMVYHIRTDGNPNLASGLLLTANVLNFLFIPVFIHFIRDLSACSWAMFTGYGVSTLGLYLYYKSSRRTLQWIVPHSLLSDISLLIKNGFPVAAAGLLTPMMIFFISRLVMHHAGEHGLAVYSVVISCILIISMCISGVSQTMVPMIGILYGEKDWKGLRFVFQLSLGLVGLFAVILFVFLESVPEFLLKLFGMTQPEILEIGCISLRLFAPAVIGIAIVALLRSYSQAVARPMVSLTILFVEVIGAMLPATWFLSLCFGYYGIWMGYVVAEYMAVTVYIIYCFYVVKTSGGNRRGLLLLPHEENGKIKLVDTTICDGDGDDLTQLLARIEDSAAQGGIPADFTHQLTQLTEKTVIMVFEHGNIKQPARHIDVMIDVAPSEAVINLRFDGSPVEMTELNDFPAVETECAQHLGFNHWRLRLLMSPPPLGEG